MNIKQADLQPRLDYYYSVFNADGETTHEWLTEAHRLDFSALNGTHYVVYDHWIDIPEDTYLYSSAFYGVYSSSARNRCQGYSF